MSQVNPPRRQTMRRAPLSREARVVKGLEKAETIIALARRDKAVRSEHLARLLWAMRFDTAELSGFAGGLFDALVQSPEAAR